MLWATLGRVKREERREKRMEERREKRRDEVMEKAYSDE